MYTKEKQELIDYIMALTAEQADKLIQNLPEICKKCGVEYGGKADER